MTTTLWIGLLAGCGIQSDDDTEPEMCEAVIRETTPESDARGVFAEDPIVIRFSKPHHEDARTWVDGVEVTHTWNDDRTRVTVLTDGLLQPEATHEVRVAGCVDERTWQFETSDLGLPMHTLPEQGPWLVLPWSGEVGEPEGIGTALRPYFCTLELTVGEAAGQSVPLGLRARTEDLEDLDTCDAWPDVAPVEGQVPEDALPDFVLGPTNDALDGDALGCLLPHEDWTFSGTFSPDGTELSATLEGRIDVRQLTWTENTDVEWCTYLAGFGAPCEPCTDGALFCVDGLAWSIPGEPDDGLWPADPPTQDDCHAECAESSCNPDCSLYAPTPTSIANGATLDHDLRAAFQSSPAPTPELGELLDDAALALTLGQPDFCAETFSLAWTLGGDPIRTHSASKMSGQDLTFTMGELDTTLSLDGADRDFFETTWSGRLQAGGAEVADLILTGLLDIGDVILDGALGCVAAEAAGQPCEACPDDGVEGCLQVSVAFPTQAAAP